MPDRVLIDTHMLIWMATAADRIPPRFATALLTAERRYVSLVSAWEVQIKSAKNSNKFRFSLREFELAMKEFCCTELPISYEDVRSLDRMKFLHSDPFDCLLMGQSFSRDLPLATFDINILETARKFKEFSIFNLALISV